MFTQQLILLRHAKSDWNHDAADADFHRPLNRRGQRDARAMGEWLWKNGYAPEVTLASPAARASATVDLLAAAWPPGLVEVIYDKRLYHAAAAAIRALAAAQFQRHKRVMIVAHNPGLASALLEYCPAAEPFADRKLMPTCAAAVLDFEGGPGGPGAPGAVGAAQLRVLMRPSGL